MAGTKFGWILAGLLSAAGPIQAAPKILLYLSPFGKSTVCPMGNASFGYYYACKDSAAAAMKLNPQGWMQYTYTGAGADTVDNSSFQLAHSSDGNSNDFQTDNFDPYPLFKLHDTVWVIPDPYPSGKGVKLLTAPPRTRVVMLWDPWPADTAAPRMKVAAWNWSTMSGNPTLPGWYSGLVVGFDSLSLLFRDSALSQYFGGHGVSATDATPLNVDSVGNSSDTIWIRGTPEVSPTRTIATPVQPKDKVVMLFNPWNGVFPIQHPLVTIDGNGPYPTYANANYCGWYSFSYFDRTPKVRFANQKTGAKFGKLGMGDATEIDLSSIASDTAWISVSGGMPTVSTEVSAYRGMCEVSYLAATIRDFPSDGSNREFAHGKGCGRGGWNVVKGMVDSILGADRKPIRSPYDTTWKGIRTSWGGYDWGFRCTYDTLPGATAEIGDTGIATSWFRSAPGKNAETCRDIPLVLDSTGTYYVNDSKYFFPIDDFSRLPGGAPNPYYDQIRGEDGKLHNFSFCLESHGDFEYRKGQVFHFAGDDDVWFFINNKLAVDLGGVHGTSTDSVNLDRLGLVEGTTYPFDFFFCERDPQGSDMMIQTTMNMRTNSSFRVVDSLALDSANGGKHYFVKVSVTTGQGCRAVTKVSRATAAVRISGPSFPSPRPLSTGTWYGGISVDSAAGYIRVDSASIAGLAAGTYTLTLVSTLDSTAIRQIRFVVPFTVGPLFTNRHAIRVVPGDTFVVAVGAFNANGVDSSSIAFRIRPSGGLVLFADSLLTRPVGPADTLRTGLDGKVRRIWAQAVRSGTWTLTIGSGPSDTADRWDSIVVLRRSLAFVDSTGRRISPLGALVLRSGERRQLRAGLFVGDSLCRSCTGTAALLSSTPFLRLASAPGGAATDSVIFSAGIASFWMEGTAAFDSAAVSAILASDTSARATWSPVSVLGWRIRFVDSTGAPVGNPPVVLDPGEDVRLRAGLFLGDSLCASCSGSIRLSASTPLLVPSTVPGGSKTDSVTISGGFASFWARGTAPFDSASISAVLASDSTVRGVRFPLSVLPWRLRFLSGSKASDTLVPISQMEWSSAPVVVQVWGRSGPCATCAGTLDLAASSPGIVFRTPGGTPATSVAIDSGKASFLVFGATPSFEDTLFLKSSLGPALTGHPVNFMSYPPDSARMFDADADGRADSLVVHLHRPHMANSAFSAAWPGPNPQTRASRVVELDSTDIALIFDPPFGTDLTDSLGAGGLYSWNGNPNTWQGFPIADGVPPVPTGARITWGDGISTPDTLRVALSEPVRGTSRSPFVRLGRGAGVPDASDARFILGSADSLILLWAPGSLASCPRPGDSLGLLPSLTDGSGNPGSLHGKKIAIDGLPRPPKFGVYLDTDGDGRIDAIRIALAAPVADPLQSFDLELPGRTGLEKRTSVVAVRVPGDSLTLLAIPSVPFPFGWTSFPSGGKWASTAGGAGFPVLDGAGPSIDTALIRHTESYDGGDTLLVVPSEPLAGAPSIAWWKVLSGGQEMDLPVGPVAHRGDTLVVVLPSTAVEGVRPGDSLRFTPLVLDTLGNAASQRWRPVGGAPRPAFLRLTPPSPLVRPDPAAAESPALEIQIRSASSWRGADGGTSRCDTIACTGPTLELNQATTLVVHVYDLMGVHVASAQGNFDPAALPTDRLGRVRVRILWNGRDENRHPVAPGVFLVRGILRSGDASGEPRIRNAVWKVGILPPAK